MLFPTYYSYGSHLYKVTEEEVIQLSPDGRAYWNMPGEYKSGQRAKLKSGSIGVKEIEEGVWLKAFELFEQQLKKVA